MFEPLPDDEQIDQPEERPAVSKTTVAVVVAAMSVFGFGSYAVHEHNVARDLSQQNSKIESSLQATNAQLQELTSKLNEVASAKPAPEAVQTPTQATTASHRSAAKAKHVATQRRAVRRDDPRWQKLQSQLDEQGKAIASTQQDLSSAKTELQGSIARTHNELVVLQKRGERRYYEFDIQKSKQFSPAGNMNVKLRKSNVKHQYADLDLLVDDRVVTKKHVNLYEPTQFYTGDNEQPILVVINSITKDHIHGYVSEPKYMKSELANMQQDAEQGTTNTAAATPVRERQRLPVESK